MSSYRYINHTADLGIEVKARTFKELLKNISNAIFETQISGAVDAVKIMRFSIQSKTLGDLVIDWCRELIYNFAVKGFIPKIYRISIKKSSLAAELTGDTFSIEKHKVKLEIKNVTYHKFKLKKLQTGYKAMLIFDV
jgi:SHS2 domain-containing protein